MFRRKLNCLRRKPRFGSLFLFLIVFSVYAVIWKVSVFTDGSPVDVSGQLVSIARQNGTLYLRPTVREGIKYNYTAILKNNNNRTVDKHGCEKWFNDSFEENLKHIASYPRGSADNYMYKIVGNVNQQKSRLEEFPVIGTAASSGFYRVTQGLIKSVYEIVLPKYKNVKIVYYDLGLRDDQRAQLKKYCTICELRRFLFDEVPPHVRTLKTYAWKPIIVKKLLLEFGWVWWMDSSVRFLTNDLDQALQYSKDNSILFFTYDVVFAVAQHTDKRTMTYLGEDTCKFRHFGEVEATFVLFYFDDVTNIVVDQWTACALNKECIAPAGSDRKLACRISNRADGRCHRFDQAVLGILLRRLFHEQNNYPLVSTPFKIHVIKRGNIVSYFPR